MESGGHESTPGNSGPVSALFALIAGLPKGMPNTTSEGGARHEEPGDNGGPPSAPPFGSLWRARI